MTSAVDLPDLAPKVLFFLNHDDFKTCTSKLKSAYQATDAPTDHYNRLIAKGFRQVLFLSTSRLHQMVENVQTSIQKSIALALLI
jgi:hypothetical protein